MRSDIMGTPDQCIMRERPVFGMRGCDTKVRVSDALLNPDTLGLVAPRFDLVVHLAERPQASTTEATDDRAAPIL